MGRNCPAASGLEADVLSRYWPPRSSIDRARKHSTSADKRHRGKHAHRHPKEDGLSSSFRQAEPYAGVAGPQSFERPSTEQNAQETEDQGAK
jgi:hypothetical protein